MLISLYLLIGFSTCISTIKFLFSNFNNPNVFYSYAVLVLLRRLFLWPINCWIVYKELKEEEVSFD